MDAKPPEAELYLIGVSHDEGPLLREVVVQIGDYLHGYVCFACTWGTYNLKRWLKTKEG